MSANERVEDIFYDIDSDYEYLEELQLLYDRGMIIPDISGRFNPDAFLNRDEFVGIAMEVSCERCVQPHTEFSSIEKYFNTEIYFDLNNRNPYFYCIAEADSQNAVRGYDIGESCENGTSQFGERPFCPLNQINREEAIAVLLRNAGIFTISDNAEVIRDIGAGNITQSIAPDVAPRNDDGSVYTFYGYLKRAIDYQIEEFDTQGNSTVFSLIDRDSSGNIYPKRAVTKWEFLRMAYIALKTNSCREISKSTIALKTDIFEKSCSPWESDCSISNLDDPDDVYDFFGSPDWFCEEGIDDPTGYNWRFLNINSGEEFFHYGSYLDNIELRSPGEWKTYLTTKDRCGNTWQVFSTIFVDGDRKREVELGIEIYPWDCIGECEAIDPRDVWNDELDDLQWILWPDDPYDITPNIWDIYSRCVWGADSSRYVWTLINVTTWEQIVWRSEVLENFIFPSPWVWRIDLQARDECGEDYSESIFVTIPNGEQDTWDSIPVWDNEEDTQIRWGVEIYSWTCDNDCRVIDPRDVWDGPVWDANDELWPDDSYDIIPEIVTSCTGGIDEKSYKWIITNLETWAQIFQNIQILEDYIFPGPWVWRLDMQVRDQCGENFRNQIYISIPWERQDEEDSLSVSIRTNTVLWVQDFVGIFEAIVEWWQGPYTYSWDLGNGGIQTGRSIEYVYRDNDVFEVLLRAVDVNGVAWEALVTIKVLDGDACLKDSDGDAIADCEDLCPIINGSSQNNGCPIFESKCRADCSCETWYVCDSSDPLICWESGVCRAEFWISRSCLYNPQVWSIFWNTLCTTCPCESSIDFLADIRRCDLIFPAITSPDGSDIYSQWDFWEVR